jgi:hypothetical protein
MKTMFPIRARRSVPAVIGALLTLSVGAIPGAQAAGLTTKLADKGKVAPFVEAIFEYDRAAEGNGGRAPADAAERLRRIQGLATTAKAEMRALASRLKAAGETGAFDAHVEATAGAAAAELRAAGGASALLGRIGPLLDAEVSERRRASETSVGERIERLLGVGVAHAGRFRSTACAAFWYVISAGYGETFAYTSCYKY